MSGSAARSRKGIAARAQCAIAALAFAIGCARAGEPTPRELAAPATFAVSLAAGEHARYRIALDAGDAVRFAIRQDDAMLHLRVAAAGGTPAAPEMTQAGREAMLERHLLGAEARGWEIDVAAAKADRAASFRLELERAHAAAPRDREAVAAERAFAAAEAIRGAAGGVEAGRREADVERARALYREAAGRWRRIGADCAAMRAAVGLARMELALARYPQAREAAVDALRGCRGDDLAIEADRAAALRTSAAALGYEGDFEGSAARSEEALALYRRTGDVRFQGVVLGNLSAVYRSLGETSKATDAAQAALDIAVATGDAQGVEFSRDNLADAYVARGEFGRALALYRQTLDDLRRTPYPMTEGLVWNELGSLYRRMGESDDARAAWVRAREIWSTSGNRSGMAETWLSEGDAAFDEGGVATAAAAFARAREIAREDRLQSVELHALRGLARVAAANGDHARAREQLQASLDLARRLGDSVGLVAAWQLAGDFDVVARQWPQARRDYAVALDAATRAADASAAAAAQASLARVDLAGGDAARAARRIESALATVEEQRAGIADPGLRTGFFASQRQYYALAVEIGMARERGEPGRGHAENALEIAERARARGLQDLLAERSIAVTAGVDPALLAQERAASDALRRAAWRRARSEAAGAATSSLQREIGRAERALDDVRGRIRAAAPRYAEIMHPAPLRLADVRERLLDADAAILEYWLGDERSYLWRVDRDGVRSWELPPRAAIAAAAVALRDEVAMRPADPQRSIERLVADDVATERRAGQLADALAALVLPPALFDTRAHVWAVVADAELQDVSFALLLARRTEAASTALVSLPSIGALRGLRREAVAKDGAIAIYADPVFARDDPRLVAHAVAASARAGDARNDAALAELPRLPLARDEAARIAGLAGARARLHEGFAASRDAVLRADWSGHAIVHFAAHALLDERRPELSGVVLSLYDERGAAVDGFLRVNDLHALDMPVDLVVLGACDTARGRHAGGEGVYSLARAFFHAGARRVVASQWAVDDRAGAAFMQAFYRALLGEALPPAQALARAQRELREDPLWRLPYYWGGFVLQGDWR